MKLRPLRTLILAVMVWSCLSAAAAGDHFAIAVVDSETGRGVPLVELKTVNHVSWWTDSNGIIAIDEPGLMDQEVFFHVRSHGYEYPKDFLGFRGIKLKPVRGGTATIKITRLNVAERLYRITGQGVYRDSMLSGHPAPTEKPLLNGQVMGQDTVIATPYRGKIYWFWGDTERVSYALGHFGASGATSRWPGRGGLDPNLGVDLTYFVDGAGFSKPMCPLPGRGLRWIEGLMTVPDDKGVERLVARVANHRDLGYAHDWHLMLFNDEKEVFESVQRWDIHEGHDSAHPFRARVDGVEYFYLYPDWRVRADLKSLVELANYQALTCVAGDGRVHGKETEFDRDASGRAHYSWKVGADRLHSGRLRELVSAGKLKPEESWIQLHDIETGAVVQGDRGSVYWNDFRRRWIMIRSARAGEIWFAEGDTAAGPWVYARRVVSHDSYNFYNPTQHPFFDQEGGRIIYFEGTYTASFSGAREKTPRYDYNQIMYRLTLDDPRLGLPVPVYRVRRVDGEVVYLLRERVEESRAWESIEGLAFFAVPPARRRTGLIPIFVRTDGGHTVLEAGSDVALSGRPEPLFFALPASGDHSRKGIGGLWQCIARASDGAERVFALELIERAGVVQVVSKEGETTGQGSFENDRLALRMVEGGRSYSLNASLGERKLVGDWSDLDRNLQGTWSAAWTDPVSDQDKSHAVVALYEYRRDDGQRVYSTESAVSDPSLKRASEPLCRVWKNPMEVLVLDPKARPVPFGKQLGIGATKD